MKEYLCWFFRLLTAVSFAALLFAIYKDALNQNLLTRRPQAPQLEFGLTIPHQVGHRTVYISREDYQRDYDLEGYRIWSALALAVFGLIAMGLNRPGRENTG